MGIATAKNYRTAGVLGSLRAPLGTKNACCVEILFHQLTATILTLTVGGGGGSEGDRKIIFPYSGGGEGGQRDTVRNLTKLY